MNICRNLEQYARKSRVGFGNSFKHSISQPGKFLVYTHYASCRIQKDPQIRWFLAVPLHFGAFLISENLNVRNFHLQIHLII